MTHHEHVERCMELILWRHAEAEDGGEHRPDSKRRLTPRGEKQARRVASWLIEHLPPKAKVLVSPSDRTQQTAHALGLPFDLEPKIGIGADPADLIAAAGWPNGGGRGHAVVMVGHQPTLGRLAALLLSGQEADWTIKKGAVWWFSRRKRESEEQTLLRAVVNPELL